MVMNCNKHYLEQANAMRIIKFFIAPYNSKHDILGTRKIRVSLLIFNKLLLSHQIELVH